MKMNYINPITNEHVELSTEMVVPYAGMRVVMENIIDSFPVDKQAELGAELVAMVNKMFKTNAIKNAVYSNNVWVAMGEKITYGKYTIVSGENGRGYALNSVSVVTRSVKYKVDGVETVENRPAFVTYADCVKYVKAYNKEAKKAEKHCIALPHDINADADAMRMVRYCIRSINGTMDNADVEACRVRGGKYLVWLEKNNADGRKHKAQAIYDIFNAITGKEVVAIGRVINDVCLECNTSKSMYKVNTTGNEIAYITAFYNQYINSELVAIDRHKAKAPEKNSKKKTEEKPVAEAETNA